MRSRITSHSTICDVMGERQKIHSDLQIRSLLSLCQARMNLSIIDRDCDSEESPYRHRAREPGLGEISIVGAYEPNQLSLARGGRVKQNDPTNHINSVPSCI